MNVNEAVMKRKSIRSYLDQPVSEADLSTVISAGAVGPQRRGL